jgi:hypothetical protein
VSVRDITVDTVLAAIAAGCSTRADLAQRFGVLTSSKWLTDALHELGAVEDENGRLTSPGVQPTFGTCPGCGLKQWDASDLQPGEDVCVCNDPFGEEIR